MTHHMSRYSDLTLRDIPEYTDYDGDIAEVALSIFAEGREPSRALAPEVET